MATDIKSLRARLSALSSIRTAAERAIREVEAELSEAEGDPLRAAYLRAMVAEQHEEAKRLWLKIMARHYLQTGHHLDDDDRAAIEATAEQMRAVAP